MISNLSGGHTPISNRPGPHTGATPAPNPNKASRALDEAITHAETSALFLNDAYSSTHQSYDQLEGYQAPAVDIQRDTPDRDVSGSGRLLRGKMVASTESAQNASGLQYSALSTLDFAISALDQAIPELSPSMRHDALVARNQLDQHDELWNADVQLGTALATLNGGADPYVSTAEADSPGQNVAWVGAEIYGYFRDSQQAINNAGRYSGQSVSEVSSALATLRSLREQIAAQ